jgi:immune inhibitor A
MEIKNTNSTPVVVGVVGLLVACLCLCIVALGAAGIWVYQGTTSVATEFAGIITQVVVTGGPPTARTPTATPNIVRTPVPTPFGDTSETLEILLSEPIPPSDLRELAMRLKGVRDIPEVVSTTPADHPLGTRLDFWVTNNDTVQTFQVSAELTYKSENVYWFTEVGVFADESAVRDTVDRFQAGAYVVNRAFFGSEWNPGVDGDPRLYILYTRGLGGSVAGYYSSQDQYSRLANEYSNEKEMFVISADNQVPGDPYLDSVLAHEFQHMIHWYHDRNEETWMNEGSSELATLLNGFDTGFFDVAYVSNPDLQLTGWSSENSAHYGAAFLFMAYFLDRFGEEATRALVAHPENGMVAVDAVLGELGVTDPASGAPMTHADVFADWAAANFLGDRTVADGRYHYSNYPDAPTVRNPTESIRACPADRTTTVTQFGVDYFEITCSGTVTIEFTGSRQIQVVPTMPKSGRYAFWSHRNDESDTRLTRAFDFRGLTTATLVYNAWWEIETDWDYTYLVVSADGGATWDMIETPSGTGYNPVGNNLGWGYTGYSGGGSRSGEWIEETVDLSAYAGQEVLVRFEYVTDAAVNYAGFMVDDIRLLELDHATDFETGDDGWDGEGFVRMDNLLAQTFIVQVIHENGRTEVLRLPLDDANQGSLTLDLGSSGRAILVVSGSTPFTTEKASYEFSVR